MEGLEPEFNYDKEYINECIGWTPTTAQNGTAPAGANGHTGEASHAILPCGFQGMIGVLFGFPASLSRIWDLALTSRRLRE